MAKDRMFELAHDFERRTRKLLEDDKMNFRQGRYLAVDLVIFTCIVACLWRWFFR